MVHPNKLFENTQEETTKMVLEHLSKIKNPTKFDKCAQTLSEIIASNETPNFIGEFGEFVRVVKKATSSPEKPPNTSKFIKLDQHVTKPPEVVTVDKKDKSTEKDERGVCCQCDGSSCLNNMTCTITFNMSNPED